MEYRLFYPIDEQIMNIKWKRRQDVEERTDIYLISSAVSDESDNIHIEYGLKLRNRKKLELKIRQQRFPDGQELWLKDVYWHGGHNVTSVPVIIQTLRNANQIKLAERLSASEPIILCYIHKFRQQKVVAHSLVQEQTGLHIRFVNSNNNAQIGDDLFFETISIESVDSKAIDSKYLENLRHGNVVVANKPMGYPEFLFLQYKKLTEQE